MHEPPEHLHRRNDAQPDKVRAEYVPTKTKTEIEITTLHEKHGAMHIDISKVQKYNSY